MPGKWVKFARYCSLERSTLMAVTFFTIVSCASSGTDFRTDSLSQLQPGLSTESDAITALDSPPTQRVNNADGTHLLVWSHAKVSFGDIESKAISIIFDSDGVMLGFNRGVNVDLPITEPSGRQLGIYVTSRLPNGEYMPIISTLKKQGERAAHVEGESNALWILADFIDVVVHIFYHETRTFYNLERLWREAPKEHISIKWENLLSKKK